MTNDIEALILRRATDSDGIERCEWCGAINHQAHPDTGVRAMLTIARLYDQDEANEDPDNLAAVCLDCRRKHEATLGRQRRTRPRRQPRRTTRQLSLWSD
jgi:hypothetical protein